MKNLSKMLISRTGKPSLLCNYDDGGGYDDGGFDTAGLIESLASNATSAYEQSQALNANPLNTALLYGGTAQTGQGYAAAQPSVMTSNGGMSLLLLLLAGGVIVYAVTR